MSLFTKKWVFSFFASFLATLAVGFFIWDIFISPNSSVLSFRVFTGAISSNYIETVPAASDFVLDISDSQVNLEENLPNLNNTASIDLVVEPESFQDQLDDIQEKLDVIAQKVQELIAEQNQGIKADEVDEEKDTDDKDIQDENKDQDIVDQDSNNVYPKILISEVQTTWAGDDKQEFVELYNPNAEAVDLTGWYLQRKTASASSWSSYAGSSLFSGKIVEANGYFLIARTGYYPFADVFTDSAITNDNSFALKNPKGEISDKLGFGNAIDPESAPAQNPGTGQSIGRKVDDGVEQDFDVNSIDFELQMPTPKAQNVAYIFPIISGGGGGGSSGSGSVDNCENSPDLKNVLISEFQVEGETVNDDWVELYNPNDEIFCLNGWSIQKASNTGNIGRVKNFSNDAKISGKSYFLIVRNDANQELLNLADMTASGLQLSSTSKSGGNTIYLVSKKDEIVDRDDPDIIDKVGFGVAKDYKVLPAIMPNEKNRSTGRIWDEALEEYKNTGNNSVDFEIDTPTPKTQNIAYVEPPAPTLESIVITTPAEKLVYNVGDEVDITGLVVTGNYSDGSTQIEEMSLENITGFDSSMTIDGQVLTITIDGLTATYTIDVLELIVSKNILINEIQVAGQTAADEFVELYNPNDKNIDLSGYTLKKKTSTGTESNLVSSASFSGIIPALGYFLITPQENDDGTEKYTGQAFPDLRYSGKSYSVAANNTVLLYDDSGVLQDRVGFGSAVDFETAFAPNPDSGQSIARTSGTDTNDNSVDFIILDTPTPKE